MRSALFFSFASVTLAGSIYACSSGPAQGSEGGACYGNGSCNAGLTCLSNLCVKEGVDSGGTDSGGTDSGGTDAPNDAVISDAGKDAAKGDAALTYKDCPEAGTSNDCFACCDSIDPDAGAPFNTTFDNCSCDGGGSCTSLCSTNYCVNQNGDTNCNNCLKNTCAPNAVTNCQQYVKCSAWLNCNNSCP